MEQSTASQPVAKSSSKASKKGPKSKGPGRKAKKGEPVETSSQMDIDSHNGDAEVSEPQRATKGRGKKRNSEEISGYEDVTRNEVDQSQHEPPPKRQATKTRNVGNKSTASAPENPELTESDEQPSRTTRKGSKAGGKKRNTSKARKATTATKTSSKPRLPNDDEIDTQLEAQLEKDDSDGMEIDKQEPATEPQDHSIDDDVQLEQPKKPQGKTKASTKNASATAKSKAIPDSILILSSDPDFDMDNSIVPVNAPPTKGQKAGETASRHDTSRTAESTLKNSNKAQQQQIAAQESVVYMGAKEKAVPISCDPGSESPAHEQETMSIGNYESPAVPKIGPAQSKDSPVAQADTANGEETLDSGLHIHTDIASPPAPAQQCTPSASPQSSDAENKPPSNMQNMLSTAKSQPTKAPRAEGTPVTSPSKKQQHGGQLSTKYPWNPVDIDEILLGDADDKENVNLSGILHAVKGDLATPEKQMTVEEWIHSNGQSAEEKLKAECEKMVSMFETEGARAMRALEGIECVE